MTTTLHEVTAPPERPLKRIQAMTCCTCNAATRGRQWWNRDNGFGLCPKCADWIATREGAEDMRRLYGERGVHYDIRDNESP